MVTLSRGLFQVMISLDCFLLVSIILQNPEDWEFSLVHLPDDPIEFSQPSTSKRRVQDEAKTSERHVQPCSH